MGLEPQDECWRKEPYSHEPYLLFYFRLNLYQQLESIAGNSTTAGKGIKRNRTVLEFDDFSEASFLSADIATTSIGIQEEKGNFFTLANKGEEVSTFMDRIILRGGGIAVYFIFIFLVFGRGTSYSIPRTLIMFLKLISSTKNT